ARAFARFAPLALGLGFAVTLAARAPRLERGVPGDTSSPLLASHADVAEVASLLAARDPPGRLYNEMTTGGALIWKLAPARRVFVDGRGDLHALAGTWRESETLRKTGTGWLEILDRRGIDLALVGRGTYLERELRERS